MSRKEKIKEYCESFNPQHLYSVMQFFEWFECCEDLIGPIQAFIDSKTRELARMKRRARQEFERAGMPRVTEEEKAVYKAAAPCIEEANDDPLDPLEDFWRTEPQIAEPPKLPVVVGFCPKCSSTMVGDALPACESEKTGRHFYSECTTCSYYTEIFKGRKGRFIEMKGG